MQEYATLRAFVAVARTGSVSRAAEQLHLTQPAISLKLKQLQANIGLTLFSRRPQGLALTADGHALLPAAEKALTSAQAFEQTAGTLHSTLRGKLSIGTIVDPEFLRLGAFLSRLMARAPQLETELQHGMSGSVLNRIEQGDLDVGFYLAPPGQGAGKGHEALAWRELTHFDYHVIAPAGWENRLTDTRWEHLATLPWIVTPQDSAHHRLLKQALAPSGAVPNRVAQVDQEACMLDLVRAGVGLSLARDALAMTERQESGLAVADNIRLPCALSFIWRHVSANEPSVNAALSTLDEVWPHRLG
ncbi:LysR family transcriptional regulator [Vreelandella boliviensis]|uniref:HTH-type transcriptional regulator ilvR n=1 Tax=Vreelandella boliviensis LC1 TaxID=1072583 RepID=A0A265DVI9_9GAMM|nr:LysR family transcriptional regulator [Halomonas boliviensis]EHJ92658.1 HTH-type transcriptional regulator ilvR [Halomonas boliviensis LC1]OZT73344.1 LysR family transcriptional regulator [Halomonas boliviensis LC1]